MLSPSDIGTYTTHTHIQQKHTNLIAKMIDFMYFFIYNRNKFMFKVNECLEISCKEKKEYIIIEVMVNKEAILNKNPYCNDAETIVLLILEVYRMKTYTKYNKRYYLLYRMINVTRTTAECIYKTES